MNRTASPSAAALTGALLAAVILLVSSGLSVDGMVRGDGTISRYVASHLTTPPEQIDQAVRASGSSLRYSRISFPVAIWLTSGGQDSAMRYAQPALTVASAAAVTAAAVLLVPQAGLIAGLFVLATPAMVVSIGGSFGETFALALTFWGILLARRRAWVAAALLFSGAILAKEVAAAALVVTAFFAWREGERKGAATIAAGAAAPIAWHLLLLIRFGHLPLFDPFVEQAGGLTAPGVGILQSLTDASPRVVGLAAAHIALVLAVLIFARRSIFGAICIVAGLQLLNSSPDWWTYIGDSFRVNLIVQSSAVLAFLIAWHRRRGADQPPPDQ